LSFNQGSIRKHQFFKKLYVVLNMGGMSLQIQHLNQNTVRAVPYILSIILPTRNERGNIAPLMDRVEQSVKGYSTEVIFVDDSDDDTVEEIRRVAKKSSLAVNLIARPRGCRSGGLGGAVVEGFRVAQGHWVCVMDADLQHPPEMIVKLLRHAQSNDCNLVIGSRFADGASTPGLNDLRSAISHSLILSARVLFIEKLRRIKDPLTGFFLIRREKLDLSRLYPIGFKILLEIIVQFPELRISELGFEMASRHSGDSKASVREVLRYIYKLVELRFTRGDPHFFRFFLVGFSGIFVNSLALIFFREALQMHYLLAAGLATQVSTGWNFLHTDEWVFHDRRDAISLIRRIASFYILNNLILLARGPFISLQVESFHFNYAFANVLTLLAVAVLRYKVSRDLIWQNSHRKQDEIKSNKELELPT
jgi:dolichol-phosphate mannosyltransferase